MDFAPNQTIDFKFTSTAVDSHIPTSLVGGAIVAYKDDVLTPISAGITLTADFNSITGLNNVHVVASTANGFTAGSSYALVISAGTVGGQSCEGTKVGEFTIGRGAASAAEPIETTRTSSALTVGTETGTSANTTVEDGTYWQITSIVSGLDAELTFNIGTEGNENPSALRIWGRFDSGKNRELQVQGWNYTAGTWENLGTTIKDGRNTDQEYLLSLGRAFVRRGSGPGTDGDVRIRFLYDTTVSGKIQAGDDLYLDKVSCFHTLESITTGELLRIILDGNPQRNYPESAIVVDLENGTPGTTYGVNGTPGTPVNSIAAARTLADVAGFNRYIIRSSTAIVLTTAHDDWEFVISPSGSVDMNGQSVDNSSFLGGTLKGIGLAAAEGIFAAGCRLEGVTSQGIFRGCTLPQANSLTANGSNLFVLGGRSVRPGTDNPGINGGNQANLSLSIVDYGGGIDLAGLADTANVTISGRGSVNLTDAASAATVIISGHMRRGASLPTGITLISDARIDTGQVTDSVNNQAVPLPGQAAPVAAPTLAQAIAQQHQSLVSKHDQNSALQRQYAADGSTVNQQRTVSEAGGTTTLGELVAGT